MDNILYREHPAMFRNHPILFIVCLLLCFVIVGIPIMIVWWVKCLGTTLTVTDEYTSLRRGILSKYTNDVMHDNVRNIQVRQSLLQRLLNVGYIGISSAGQAGLEIEVNGIPNPVEVKRIIGEYAED